MANVTLVIDLAKDVFAVRDVDAAGCAVLVHCESVTRPNMGFVPVKNLHQKAQLMVHRARQGS